MTNECNGVTTVEANITARVDKQDQRFFPDQFSGTPSGVSLVASSDSTHLNIGYGQPLGQGTHNLTHTQFRINYLDPAGRTFTHSVAGAIQVKVVGNVHTGTLTGVKVDGTGSGAGSQAELSGNYVIIVS
ncbi:MULTISPECIES: hypothetical protein [Pseudomonas]|uniref:hypothetical protein n=1 Tax=Pseudomonas TaxID=286 RepID=UPI000C06FD99|nr:MULTISPECIES: hypothetical protein [Pseudomonas]MBH3423172.1 hypothetical protein [Pseudomonas gessardii]NNA90148.1 hypothetical protein [Pseudomonas gessardii]PHN61782.1 hypothetical protein AO268_15460 [Pseudomonas sp. ICMP 8385]